MKIGARAPEVRVSMQIDEMDGDETELQQARHGDAAAFARVATRYWEPIARVAFNLIGAASEAAKVTGEALLLALIPEHRSIPFRILLYRQAIRLALERRPPAQRSADTLLPRFDVAGDLVWPPRAWPEELPHGVDLADVLRGALRGLPDPECAALVLSEIEQLPLDEAAEILKTSPADVRLRTRRALVMLTCSLDVSITSEQ